MLARSVLGHHEAEARAAADGVRVPGLTSAEARVEIELKGMVHGLTRRIMIENAAITQMVIEQVEAAAKNINLAEVVRQEIKRAGETLRETVATLVRSEIRKRIENEVAEKLGDRPRQLASKLAERMWDALFKLA